MAFLHYCWCGGSTDPKYRVPATMGPNSASQLWINNMEGNTGPDFAIHYWFAGGEDEFQFQDALDQPGLVAMLHVNSVSDLLADGKLSNKRVNGGEKLIDFVIRQLLGANMFSAAKDLMSMCILWKHGGVYMDTTTLLDEHQIGQALLLEPKHATFMQVPGGDKTATFMSGKKGLKAKYTARDVGMHVVRKNDGGYKKGFVKTHNVDVWGISAPKEDPLVYKIIKGYVGRCEYIFGDEKIVHPDPGKLAATT